jgi:hypothetical protein
MSCIRRSSSGEISGNVESLSDSAAVRQSLIIKALKIGGASRTYPPFVVSYIR